MRENPCLSAFSIPKALTLGAALTLAFVTTGCFHLPPLEPVAASGMSCGVDKLEVEKTGYGRVVKGCGKTDMYLYDGSLKKWVSLRERAAFEMNCKKDEIELTVLDSMSFGVQACGNRAVYKTDWMHGFVMNSSSEPKDKGAAADAAKP